MANLYARRTLPTTRDNRVRVAHYHIQKVMEDILASDVLLLEVIAGGEHRWRNTFMREFRGLPIDGEMPKLLWTVFLQGFQQKFGTQKPSKVLDSLHVSTPPTQREIDDSWVHESASSDDARRYFEVA